MQYFILFIILLAIGGLTTPLLPSKKSTKLVIKDSAGPPPELFKQK